MIVPFSKLASNMYIKTQNKFYINSFRKIEDFIRFFFDDLRRFYYRAQSWLFAADAEDLKFISEKHFRHWTLISLYSYQTFIPENSKNYKQSYIYLKPLDFTKASIPRHRGGVKYVFDPPYFDRGLS